MKRAPIPIGSKFFRLTVIAEAPAQIRSNGLKRHCVLVRCDCGNEKIISELSLKSSNTKSCGCITNERLVNNPPGFKHGYTENGGSPEYLIWAGIRGRCNTISHGAYSNYGAKGITICDRWNSFENFLTDMGKRPSNKHSIDRIDVNGNYEPSNCRWATSKLQASNRTTSKNVTINNQFYCFHDAAKLLKVNKTRLQRISKVFNISYQEVIDLFVANPEISFKQIAQIYTPVNLIGVY